MDARTRNSTTSSLCRLSILSTVVPPDVLFDFRSAIEVLRRSNLIAVSQPDGSNRQRPVEAMNRSLRLVRPTTLRTLPPSSALSKASFRTISNSSSSTIAASRPSALFKPAQTALTLHAFKPLGVVRFASSSGHGSSSKDAKDTKVGKQAGGSGGADSAKANTAKASANPVPEQEQSAVSSALGEVSRPALPWRDCLRPLFPQSPLEVAVSRTGDRRGRSQEF